MTNIDSLTSSFDRLSVMKEVCMKYEVEQGESITQCKKKLDKVYVNIRQHEEGKDARYSSRKALKKSFKVSEKVSPEYARSKGLDCLLHRI